MRNQLFHDVLFFFFNDTATTEIYTLSLHDALPILARTGNSHATIAAVTSPARDARTTRSFSRARRDDSLCLNVMGLAPSCVCASRIEELAHVASLSASAGSGPKLARLAEDKPTARTPIAL